ncbi:MAG TPA: hypothetical protein VM282_13175 [Acidimicrobiales bacterium]|nr:hypothetical protein [Acidimicrobiales bacterium]
MIAQGVAIATGAWLMVAPPILDYSGSRADDVHRSIGPLLVTFGIIAVSGVTRTLHWVNVALAGCLLATPLAGGHPAPATAAAIVSAAAVLGTARFTGTSTQSQGGGWKALGTPTVRR